MFGKKKYSFRLSSMTLCDKKRSPCGNLTLVLLLIAVQFPLVSGSSKKPSQQQLYCNFNALCLQLAFENKQAVPYLKRSDLTE